MDLETQMKIDEIIDDAYERANELIDTFENSPDDRVYRTIRVQRGNPKSYTDAFYHYYSGVFEGLLMTLFLHEFDEWPTKEQKKFMQDSIFESKKWSDYVDKITKYILSAYKEDLKSD